METSASFEARSAPLPYPTFCQGRIYRESVGNFRVAYSDLSRTSFNGTGGDGADPLADLVRNSTGNLYGRTASGGAESVLHSFTGGSGGEYPEAGLVQDGVGNLYGTTYAGGASGFGTVFKIDTKGNETVLYSFRGGSDGEYPPPFWSGTRRATFTAPPRMAAHSAPEQCSS